MAAQNHAHRDGCRSRRRNGFTIIELVIVMLIVGILAAIVSVKVNAQEEQSVVAQSDEFRRNLSHLQLVAISQSQRLELTTTATGYTVAACTTSACTTTTALTDPATGSNFSVVLTNGVTLSPAGKLDFDSLGRPQSSGSLVTAATTYTLSGAGRSVTVTVSPLTGFAQTGS